METLKPGCASSLPLLHVNSAGPNSIICTIHCQTKSTIKVPKKVPKKLPAKRSYPWPYRNDSKDTSPDLHIKALSDALNIPPELATTLWMISPDEPWRERFEKSPRSCISRIQYLESVVGITKPEIVEQLSLIVGKSSFDGYIPPKIFEKREKLDPFKSHAEFCANLYSVPLNTFYLAAAREPRLLKLKENNMQKANILIKFGYPKHLVLKRWVMFNTLSVARVKKRIEMIEELEKAGVDVQREYIYGTAHLLQDEGGFITFFLKLVDRWNEDHIPPRVKNRVTAFAQILKVSPEEVICQANLDNSVGIALFKDEYRLNEVVDIFDEIGVRNVTMLRNCRFFENKPKDIRAGIEAVKMLYPSESFRQMHLNQLRSIVDKGKLLQSQRPFVHAVGKKAKGLWASTPINARNPTRKYLLKVGFKYADLLDCDDVLHFPADLLQHVVETRTEFLAEQKIAAASNEDRLKLLNLLQYFAEKDEAEYGDPEIAPVQIEEQQENKEDADQDEDGDDDEEEEEEDDEEEDDEEEDDEESDSDELN